MSLQTQPPKKKPRKRYRPGEPRPKPGRPRKSPDLNDILGSEITIEAVTRDNGGIDDEDQSREFIPPYVQKRTTFLGKPIPSSNNPRSQPHFFEELALKYCSDVISGAVPAGKYVRLACERHLKDLEKSKDPKYPYEFNFEKGERACKFIELLPHTKGQWAQRKEKIVLEPWQAFIVMTLFGWLRRFGVKAGKRRFRKAYAEIPRKNGKSLLAAAIGNYMFIADGEFGAEVYSGATTEKQAWEVYRPAKLMIERSENIKERFGIEVCAKTMVIGTKGSKFEPVIGNPGDGPSPSCAIVDEYHEHQTPALHDSMETGMGAREQPLLLVITTAGYNLASPCFDMHDESCKVLEGTVELEDLFCIMYGIDEKDDWADPKILRKANPNYDVSVDGDFLESQQRAAMINPLQQGKFKTKHLNEWCNVLNAWMNMQLWNLAADPMLEEDELLNDKEAKRVIAFDLASKTDLCSEQRLYWKMLAGKVHYYLFGRYWLPEDTIDEEGPNHAHYKKWVKSLHLTPTDGATVDYAAITEQIVEDCKKINPQEVVYDPFNATQMSQDITDAGIKVCVEFVQQPHNFAIPMDEIAAALKDGRFHHDGNPITTWCMANVVARPTKKGLFAPMKIKPHAKIDGAVATMMGVARAVAVHDPKRKFQLFSIGN